MAGALNVAELIAARGAAEPVRPALLHSGGTESYGELLARADMIAARLRPMLHGPAPRVALLCPNGPDYVALALAILRTGACLGPVAGELVVPEHVAQLALTAPQLMLTVGPEQWLPAPGVAEAIAGIRFSWCALDIAAAFSEHRFATLHPAFLRFSSGTTGDRKGVRSRGCARPTADSGSPPRTECSGPCRWRITSPFRSCSTSSKARVW
jgi:long-chain acyl-CoA synthetase